MTTLEFIAKLNAHIPQPPLELLGSDSAPLPEKKEAIQRYATALQTRARKEAEDSAQLARDWAARQDGSPELLTELLAVFPTQHYALRGMLTGLIGMLNTPESLQALHQILQNDPSTEVRCKAADELGEHGGPEEEAALLALLDTSYQQYAIPKDTEGIWQDMKNMATFGAIRDIRWGATHGLGHLKSKAAVPKLIMLLGDPSALCQYGVFHALGEIGDTSAIAPLEKFKSELPIESRFHASIDKTLGKLRPSLAQGIVS